LAVLHGELVIPFAVKVPQEAEGSVRVLGMAKLNYYLEVVFHLVPYEGKKGTSVVALRAEAPVIVSRAGISPPADSLPVVGEQRMRIADLALFGKGELAAAATLPRPELVMDEKGRCAVVVDAARCKKPVTKVLLRLWQVLVMRAGGREKMVKGAVVLAEDDGADAGQKLAREMSFVLGDKGKVYPSTTAKNWSVTHTLVVEVSTGLMGSMLKIELPVVVLPSKNQSSSGSLASLSCIMSCTSD